MADQVNALIDQLIARGVAPEQIKQLAEARTAEPTKQYFLEDLKDPNLSPEDYAVKLTVTNWASIVAFFRKEPTEQFNPQRAYQAIRSEVQEAIRERNPEKLILALMMGAKAVL
jgi:hypothetical protein